MSLAFAPIVCTPYVSLGSSVVSVDASAWSWPDESPALADPVAVATADAAAAVADRVRRADAPASVIAWRANYYAFRHARTRVEAGRAADAVPFIVGPCAAYVQSRLAELARTDARYADALALAAAGTTAAAIVDTAAERAAVDFACEATAPTNQPVAPQVDESPTIVAAVATPTADVDRADFLRRVKLAALFADARSAKMPLRCVRLTIAGGRLTLSASNLRSVARVVVPGAVVAGDLVVDIEAAQLVDALAGKAKRVTLTLEAHGATLIVAANGSRAVVPAMNAELPHRVAIDPTGAPWLALPMGAAIRAAELASFAVSKEGTRYAFNGMLLTVDAGRLEIYTTDGRRLVRVPLAAVDGPRESIILHRDDVARLRKLAAKRSPDDVLQVRIGEKLDDKGDARWIELHGPGFAIECASIDGQFPPCVEVIPRESPRACVLDVAAFADALERGASACTDDGRGVRFTFAADGSTVTIASRCDGREASAVLELAERSGDWSDVKPIGFNPNLLADFLAAARAGRVTFAFSAPNRPGLFELADRTQFVQMPVNLS